MTVAELIEELKKMPQDVEVTNGEGKEPDPEFFEEDTCQPAMVIL